MTILSDERLNDGLTMAVKWVEDCLADKKHTDFTPTMLVHAMEEGDEEIAVTVAAMPGFEMAKRYETLAMLGAKFGEDKVTVVAIYFVTEVWISSSNADGSRKYAMPEQDPDRREAVNVAALSFDGRAAMGQVAVTRNKRNRMIPGVTSFYPYGGEVKTENKICQAFYRGLVLGMMGTLAQGKQP